MRVLSCFILLWAMGGCTFELYNEPIPVPASYATDSSVDGATQPVEKIAVIAPTTRATTQATTQPTFTFDGKAREQLLKTVQGNIFKRYPELKDAKLNEYLVLVGSVITINTPKPEIEYAYVVLDTDQPIACGIAPKTICISKGLLRQMEDEAELAGVIGREMSNLLAGRALKAAGLPADATTRPVQGDAASAAGQLTQKLLSGSLGTELDQQADLEGARFAAAARYAPDGYLRLLARQKADWQRIKALDANVAIIAKAYPTADVRLPVRFEAYVKSPKSEIRNPNQ